MAQAAAEAQKTSLKQVCVATLVGGVIEWYDFALYGLVAALVFNKLFFPSVDPTLGTLAALGTFAVGFFARPLGGIVFGHFGDRIGRKTMLVVTMLMMGIGTFVIGLLPTYAQIGIWAPVALVVLRFFQGFGVGGEWGGAVLVAVEYAPPGRRGLLQVFPQMGAPLGSVCASAMLAALSQLPQPQFLAWGWRIPFLVSVLLVPVGLYVRFRVAETPLFERVKKQRAELRNPIWEAIKAHPRSMLLTLGLRQVENGSIYLITVYVLAFATEHMGVPRGAFLTGTALGYGIAVATILAAGALSDRVGRKPVYLFGTAVVGLTAFPLFWLLETRDPVLVAVGVLLPIAFGSQLMYGAEGAWIAEFFGTRHRYSGASVAYQAAAVPAGGLAPFVATGLVALGGGGWWPIAAYLVAMAVISAVCTFLAPETFRTRIDEDVQAASEVPAAAGAAVLGPARTE